MDEYAMLLEAESRMLRDLRKHPRKLTPEEYCELLTRYMNGNE